MNPSRTILLHIIDKLQILFIQVKYFRSFEGKGALFHHCKMEKTQRMNPQIMFSELSIKHTMRTSVSSIV
jgi:hypothetical protein